MINFFNKFGTALLALIFLALAFAVHGVPSANALLLGSLGLGTVLGPRMLVDLAIPPGVDGSKIFQFNMRAGLTPQAVIGKAAAAIGAVNQSLVQQYGAFIFFTTELFAFYRQGADGRSMTPKKAEGKQADPVKADTIGHMLPNEDYEDAIAWTQLYLRDASEMKLDADVALISDRWQNRVDWEVVRRLLTTNEYLIGNNGYDVPWAIGTGTSVNYIPPQYRTYKFDDTHSHFKGVAGSTSADVGTLLNNMLDDLRHHGHQGRVVSLVSDQDVDKYMGLNSQSARFVEINPQQFQLVAGNTNAPISYANGEIQGVPGELFGYVKLRKGIVELRYHERFPSTYLWMGKTYGSNSPKNPLAIRLHPNEGAFGLKVKPQVTQDIEPELDKVMFKANHGIGVNDRTNGVAGQFGSATYTNPTISEE